MVTNDDSRIPNAAVVIEIKEMFDYYRLSIIGHRSESDISTALDIIEELYKQEDTQ